MRYALILTIAFSILVPSGTFAQLDQRCFTCNACISARKDLGSVNTAGSSCDGPRFPDGFVQNSETIAACGQKSVTEGNTQQLGFCLPAGSTRTDVTFGGRDTFANLADFIDYGYRYAIIVAGVLAVIMIIVSGFQWIISGGSSETISSAKERIQHAIIGLTLAVFSYTLLNQVSPYLTSLRLPRVWLLNQQGVTPAYCNSVTNGVRLALYKDQTESPMSDQQKTDIVKDTNRFTVEKTAAACGKAYFMSGAGTQFCQGTVCPTSLGGQRQVCIPRLDNTTLYECRTGSIGGIIFNTSPTVNIADSSILGSISVEGWSWPWTSDVALYRVCANGNFDSVAANGKIIDQDTENKVQRYIIPTNGEATISKATQECEALRSTLKGFVVYANMDELGNVFHNEAHMLGKNGMSAVDLGDKNGEITENTGAFATTARTAAATYFISPDDIRNGLTLNIDSAEVTDIDNTDDRTVYQRFGFK